MAGSKTTEIISRIKGVEFLTRDDIRSIKAVGGVCGAVLVVGLLRGDADLTAFGISFPAVYGGLKTGASVLLRAVEGTL